VGGSVDAVDVLVIGDVEDIGQQLQLIALFDGECLLGANIVNNVPGVLSRVRSNPRNKGSSTAGPVPVRENRVSGVVAAHADGVGQAVLHLAGLLRANFTA